MSVSEILPKSWPIAPPPSIPLHLASAEPSSLTCDTAPWCRPPSLSKAKGRKTMPSARQAAAVSRTFRCACLGCSLCYIRSAERAGHGHVDRGILASNPAADGDVARSSSGAWQQILLLLGWAKISTGSRLEEYVPQQIMPRNPICWRRSTLSPLDTSAPRRPLSSARMSRCVTISPPSSARLSIRSKKKFQTKPNSAACKINFFPNQSGIGLENCTQFFGVTFPNQTGFGLEKDTE